MATYRKKPVVIEAVQVTSELRNNHGPFPEWAIPYLEGGHTDKIDNSGWLTCKTLEGPLNVSDGDYLIRGIKGEVYPCKPDIFEQTYDKVFGDEYTRAMGWKLCVLITSKGEVNRFDVELDVQSNTHEPPCIDWSSDDGKAAIKTWTVGYLK